MPKLLILALHTEDPGPENTSATRERLKSHFPPGSVRRMTQLGLLVGHCLGKLPEWTGNEALVYASRFGEGRALEDFLASFPEASPTGFQTSIHPSGAQQALIARKRAVTNFFPVAGGPMIAGQALLTALLCPERSVLLCGGEERGTWLTDVCGASDRSFAFAMTLAHEQAEAPALPVLATLELTADGNDLAPPTLAALFDTLHARQPYDGPIAPGWQLRLTWADR